MDETSTSRLRDFIARLPAVARSAAGVMMSDPAGLPQVKAALSGLFAQTYVLEHDWPQPQQETFINEHGISFILSEKKFIQRLNCLQWTCPSFAAYLCIDTDCVHCEKEACSNRLGDSRLWDYIAASASDDIEASGWASGYDRRKFSTLEMDEFADNVVAKLRPRLGPQSRVLEIGCGSGLVMFRLAPLVGHYTGVDVSARVLARDAKRLEELQIRNVSLSKTGADSIAGAFPAARFDAVILNSVVQYFDGHNYLRRVIADAVALSAERGLVFVGDVPDLADMERLVRSHVEFKKSHPQCQTRLDFSGELFLPSDFFRDLAADIPGIASVDISPKLHTVANEMTEYRYDALFSLDKANPASSPHPKVKNQYGINLAGR